MHNPIVKAYCDEAHTSHSKTILRIKRSLEHYENIDFINWNIMSYVSGLERSRFVDVYHNGWEVDPKLREFFESLLLPQPLKPFKDYM